MVEPIYEFLAILYYLSSLARHGREAYWKTGNISAARPALQAKLYALKLKDRLLHDGLYSYHILPNSVALKCSTDGSERPDADVVTELARNSNAPVLLLGEYGQGKSNACGRIAYQMATNFRTWRAARRLPILVPLTLDPDLRPASIDRTLSDLLSALNVVVSPDVVSKYRLAGRLALILDGLDELLEQAGESKVVDLFSILKAPLFSENHTIVTARPGILSHDSIRDAIGLAPMRKIRLAFVPRKDVISFLERSGNLDLLRKLPQEEAPLLYDLLKRPLFLGLAVSVPKMDPGQKPNEALLYKSYLNGWYSREREKMGSRLRNIEQSQVLHALGRVALEFVTQRTASLPATAIEDQLKIGLEEADCHLPSEDLPELLVSALDRLLLVPSLSRDYAYSFGHEALRNFLLATYACRQLEKPKGTVHLSIPPTLGPLILDIIAQDKSLDHACHELFVQRVRDLAHKCEFADVILAVWALRQKPQPGESSALFSRVLRGVKGNDRALLLTCLTGREFYGLDFTASDLGGAHVSHAVFSHCTFKDIDLTGINLERATFLDCTLKGVTVNRARMAGISIVGCSIRNLRIDESNLSGARITDSIVEASDFYHCHLGGAVLCGRKWDQLVFQTTNLSNANFTGIEAGFDCHFRNCNCEFAQFAAGTFSNSDYDRNCKIEGAAGLEESGILPSA